MFEELKGKFVEVCIDAGKERRFYHGVFEEERGDFLVIKDVVLGELYIKKERVYFIREISNVFLKTKLKIKEKLSNKLSDIGKAKTNGDT